MAAVKLPPDKAFQALPHITKGEGALAYLLSGPEAFKADLFIAEIKKKRFKGSAEVLDGGAVSGEEVLEHLVTMSLFGPSSAEGKLVVVRKANELKSTDALLAHLQDNPKSSDGSLLLLVCESFDARKKLFQHFKKTDAVLDFQPVKGPEVAAWIRYLANQEGVELAPDAAALLAVVAEESLIRLQNEIRKARAFKGEDASAITREELEAVLTGGVKFEMAELVKSVIEGRRARSLLMVPALIISSEEALGFVGFMTWGLKNPDRFRWQKAPGLERINTLVDRLLELDTRLKNSTSAGGLNPAALVESFVIEVT